MVVMILEHVTPAARGEVTRWLLEPRAGVFIGTVSAMVREKRWAFLVKKHPTCAMTMFYSAKTEQEFAIRTRGDTTRKVRDFDGLALVTRREQQLTQK
ncbi:MAG TPA: type I-E CRISPR-associated endoribonuclease Cas2e [Armatimonadota bacterium]|nr:type I-E CRISPR-associated endoribonuclease Cas2e [Armatimonadota bacterium]